MKDEHEDSHNRRGSNRRHSDLETTMDVRVLRHELQALREREDSLERKFEALDGELDRLKAQLSGAKGVLYGAGVVVSAFIFLLSDRMKDLFVK